MIIDSIQNKHIKATKKLLQNKYQKKLRQFLIEGHHLVKEALTYANPIEILVTPENQAKYSDLKCKVTLISPQVANYLSDTITPEGIFAIMPITEATLQPGNWLVFDDLQDPGNVGTILRTADFFGYQGAFFSHHSVSPYAPKVLRSSQGSNFHLQIATGAIMPFLHQLAQWQVQILGTVLHQSAHNLATYQPQEPYALVLGNEGRGLSDPVAKLINQNVIIPATGQAESLNVAVAAGILMYTLKTNTIIEGN